MLYCHSEVVFLLFSILHSQMDSLSFMTQYIFYTKLRSHNNHKMFCNGSGHGRHNFPCDQISCYNVIQNDLTVLGLIDAYNSINPDSAIRYFCCFLFFFFLAIINLISSNLNSCTRINYDKVLKTDCCFQLPYIKVSTSKLYHVNS